jgi:heme/copper-type cytochrome/quinol oxidase subunit 2
VVAFFVELIYGAFCWYVYRGGPGLLAFITIGNLANLSILSPTIPGPEQYLAGRLLLLVMFILVQIVVSLVLVGVLARHRDASTETWPADRHLAAEHR